MTFLKLRKNSFGNFYVIYGQLCLLPFQIFQFDQNPTVGTKVMYVFFSIFKKKKKCLKKKMLMSARQRCTFSAEKNVYPVWETCHLMELENFSSFHHNNLCAAKWSDENFVGIVLGTCIIFVFIKILLLFFFFRSGTCSSQTPRCLLPFHSLMYGESNALFTLEITSLKQA